MDFVSDQLANGRRFRVLNIVDDFSREYVLKIVDFSISGERVSRELDRIARALPETIVCDNVLPIQVKLFDDNRSLLRVVARNLCFSVSDSSRSAVSARFEQDALDHS